MSLLHKTVLTYFVFTKEDYRLPWVGRVLLNQKKRSL